VLYLSRYTREPMGLALGIPTLSAIFNEKFYQDLEGGIMEAFGILFKRAVTLYVYPQLEPATGRLITADRLQVDKQLQHLYAHLLDNGRLQNLQNLNPAWLTITQDEVMAQIQLGNPAWEAKVPSPAAELIKNRRYFGYPGMHAHPEKSTV